MWHWVQREPFLPGSWKWWLFASYFEARWHCAHTALPCARSFPVCGSWQSLQVTPFEYMRLERNEPQLYTSSSCWPSG